jgi:hypothetical protein
MKLPRFTTRHLLALVALAALGLGVVRLWWLRRHYPELAAAYRSMTADLTARPQAAMYWEDRWAAQFEGRRAPAPWSGGPPYVPAFVAHHKAMEARYERAARYPWLSVEPEPPEPKATP